ncbi:MAG: trypsin-like serine peptidase [Bacteriovoracaceae bacterium]
MKLLILFAFSLIGQLSASPVIIYGEDNRVDVYQSKKPILKKLADSTAAMISKDYLINENNQVLIKAPLFKNVYKLCQFERFRDQLAAANCSGTLIEEDIILTAGHCYSNDMDCKGYSWVFDYRASSEKQSQVSVPTSSVYRCKEIIAIKDDRKTNIDYALIRLDRKVVGRAPVDIRLVGEVSYKDKLAVIGHPRGLPTKIADSGDVLELFSDSIRSNLDAYTMNSGSGVFNEKTGELEGILISGESDFELDDSGCLKSQRLSNTEGDEMITKIQTIWPLIDLF